MRRKNRIAQVTADAVQYADGWRARTIRWVASGEAEVFECPFADGSLAIALLRAAALAALRYPDRRLLH